MLSEISLQAVLNAIRYFIPKLYLMLSENNFQAVHNFIEELTPKAT